MRNTPRTVAAIGALTVGVLFVAPSAFADTPDTVTQQVNAGSLTASVAHLGLTAVVSKHQLQKSTGIMTLTADDSSGTGDGWNVTEQVGAFVYSGDNGGSQNDISAANFSLTSADDPAGPAEDGQAINATGDDTTPKGPQIGNASGLTAVALSTARKVLKAGAGFGQGTYTQALNVNLDVPAQSRAGTYTATLITTITAAP